MGETEHREARGRRREFIRAHHPDRGGDPDAFIAGLRSFAGGQLPPESRPLPRVVVVRHRPLLGRLMTALAGLLRQRRNPPRVR